MSVKDGNDTLGPDGIVPLALVFGEFPTLRTILGPRVPRPTLTERAQVAQRARKLMAQELAAAKIRRSMKHKTPSATNHTYEPGDAVLVWREKIVNNRIGEFIGPFPVLAYEPHSKIVVVNQNGEKKRYTTAQIRPYIPEPDVVQDSITELNMQGLADENNA